MLKDNFHADHEYNLQYFTGPEKSYVMEPVEGEIHYNLAKKNVNKFYDEVLSQDIQ